MTICHPRHKSIIFHNILAPSKKRHKRSSFRDASLHVVKWPKNAAWMNQTIGDMTLWFGYTVYEQMAVMAEPSVQKCADTSWKGGVIQRAYNVYAAIDPENIELGGASKKYTAPKCWGAIMLLASYLRAMRSEYFIIEMDAWNKCLNCHRAVQRVTWCLFHAFNIIRLWKYQG